MLTGKIELPNDLKTLDPLMKVKNVEHTADITSEIKIIADEKPDSLKGN